jgi:hypothetical protein
MKAPYRLSPRVPYRNVEVVTYTGGKKDNPPKDNWTEILWIERDEDWYALMSAEYKNATVRIVTREAYIRSKEIG